MAKKSVTFEDKLNKLSEITTQLEAGNMTLDAMLASYEEGIKLFRECHQILEDAEAKINLIMVAEQGTAEQPFEEKEEA